MDVPPNLRESLGHSRLTEEQTRSLIAAAQAGDKSASASLLEHNERLVYSVCQKYFRSGATGDNSIDDLMQEGRMGLLHAVKKFDLARQVKFSTYATWWIRQRVRRFGIRGGMQFHMAFANIDKRAQALHTRARLCQELGREPTIDEVIKLTKISPVVARSISIKVISLDKDTFSDDEDGDKLIESLADDNPGPEYCAEQAIERQKVLDAVRGLSPREREILYRYYELGESIDAISGALSMTPYKVRLIRDDALGQVKAGLME